MTTDYYVRTASRIWHKIPASRVERKAYGTEAWQHTLQAFGAARCGRKPGGGAVGEWVFVAASVPGSRICKDCGAL